MQVEPALFLFRLWIAFVIVRVAFVFVFAHALMFHAWCARRHASKEVRQ